MKRVTFKKVWTKKEGRKLVTVISEWTEEVKTEADAKLRAMALNWDIVKIEAA